MKQKRRPFQHRKNAEGVEEFRCTKCITWKFRDDMSKASARRGGPHTLSGWCKMCTNEYTRHRYHNDPDVNARMKLNAAIQNQRNPKYSRTAPETAQFIEYLHSLQNYRILDPHHVKTILTWIDQMVDRLGTLSLAADQIRLDESTVRKLYTRQSIDLSMADKIAMETNHEMDLSEMLPEIGKDGWGPKGERACQDCGSWFHRHAYLGLCKLCAHYQWKHPGKLRLDYLMQHNGVPFGRPSYLKIRRSRKKPL